MNLFSKGIIHDDLKLFLDTNLPKPSGKKDKIQLGVSDSKIGSSINESMSMQCTHIGAIPEILRGQRKQ